MILLEKTDISSYAIPFPTLPYSYPSISQQYNLNHATFIPYMETASDSLHDIWGWKKVVKNLAAYVINHLYK